MAGRIRKALAYVASNLVLPDDNGAQLKCGGAFFGVVARFCVQAATAL